jgi:hypothetical protein
MDRSATLHERPTPVGSYGPEMNRFSAPGNMRPAPGAVGGSSAHRLTTEVQSVNLLARDWLYRGEIRAGIGAEATTANIVRAMEKRPFRAASWIVATN